MTLSPNDPVSNLITTVRNTDGALRTRAAGRLMSLVVDRPELVGRLIPSSDDPTVASCVPRPLHVIGITGPPGAGKSTLVDALIVRLLRDDPARRVFVAAVDPSSPFTGGAILGDRVRMMRHALEERVFIRSLATRGELGGVCRGVVGALAVAALWGADVALVETVGVGQNEIDVARLADVTTLVLAPGQGDGVQWLKAGLMEIADVFVVNKADRDGADALVAQLQTAVERMKSLSRRRPHAACNQEVLAVSAENGTGIEALLGTLGLLKETVAHG